MLSVIIPTLNEEKIIEKCLKRFEKQTNKNFELIVSDSYSNDDTVKKARKYAKVVMARKGIARGRNDGAKKARGEIICFIDADTLVAKNFVDTILKDFKDEKLVGWLCRIKPDNKNYKFWFDLTNFLLKFFIKIGKPHGVGFAFGIRKKAFDKIRGFNEKLTLNEDHDLAFRLSKFGKFKFSEKTYVINSTRRLRNWGLLKTLKVYLLSYPIFLLGLEAKGHEPVR